MKGLYTRKVFDKVILLLTLQLDEDKKGFMKIKKLFSHVLYYQKHFHHKTGFMADGITALCADVFTPG